MSDVVPDSRFARHDLIEGFDQQLVSKLRIGVIGAGAIGNELVKNLLLVGVGTIDVFDYDTVELSNLTRSVFLRESDLGRNKAVALVNRAQELYPACTLNAIAGSIFDTLQLSKAKTYDVIVGAIDNTEARLRINDIALITGVDWINLAIDARSTVVDVFAFKSSNSLAACYACQLPDAVFERMAKRYSCGGLQRAAYLQDTVPTTTITASIAAAQGLSELLRLVHARAGKESGQFAAQPIAINQSSRRYFDTLSFVSSQSTIAHHADCAGCGLTPRKAHIEAPQDLALLRTILRKLSKIKTSHNEDALIKLSDPIITDAVCQLHAEHSPRNLRGERAARITDSATWCAQCADHSIAIEVQSHFTADEFCALLPQLKPNALAWISLADTLIEFPTSPPRNNPHETH